MISNKLISLRLSSALLREIDSILKENLYGSRSEFIKENLRKAVDYYKTKKALAGLKANYGRGKGIREPSEKEFEKIREDAFIESAKARGFM